MGDEPLARHLASWLGHWPPAPGRVEVVGSRARTGPGWDGRPELLVAVLGPLGGVVSVPPEAADAVRAAGSDWPSAARAVLGLGDRRLVEAVLRTTPAPAPLPDVAVWVDPADVAVPPWLRPFAAPVLAALDAGGGCVGGVGLKRHDAFGHELAVGVEPAARGRGLGRRLVAQAARAVLSRGAVPTYAHRPDNVASARVAAAAGFRDTGLRLVRLDEDVHEPGETALAG
jgi:GNAT superfamily N-acetyltransferase